MAVGGEPQPDLMIGDALDVRSELTELVEVAVAAAAPIVKFDSELEARLGGANKVTLVDTEDFVVELQGRNGRLPHTHRSDLIGFDQGQAVRALEGLGHCRGGHPTRGAAPDNHIVHRSLTPRVPPTG